MKKNANFHFQFPVGMSLLELFIRFLQPGDHPGLLRRRARRRKTVASSDRRKKGKNVTASRLLVAKALDRHLWRHLTVSS
jgi:hypothetical protein